MQITTNATIRNTWVIISKILLLLKEMARQAQTDNGNYLLHRFLLQHFCSTPTTQKKKITLFCYFTCCLRPQNFAIGSEDPTASSTAYK